VGTRLRPDWFLEDPRDYPATLSIVAPAAQPQRSKQEDAFPSLTTATWTV
jgi:hypothetical protein